MNAQTLPRRIEVAAPVARVVALGFPWAVAAGLLAIFATIVGHIFLRQFRLLPGDSTTFFAIAAPLLFAVAWPALFLFSTAQLSNEPSPQSGYRRR